jgi:hypothetical protein
MSITTTDTTTLASAVTFLAVVGQGLLAHRKGKEGKRASQDSYNRLSTGIAELKAYVIGPDGENGIRGDVRELKQKVEGILDREREAGVIIEPTAKPRRRR